MQQIWKGVRQATMELRLIRKKTIKLKSSVLTNAFKLKHDKDFKLFNINIFNLN